MIPHIERLEYIKTYFSKTLITLKSKRILPILSLLFFLSITFITVWAVRNQKQNVRKQAKELDSSLSTYEAIRGHPYDLWADIEIGRRDFSEIGPNEVVPYKLFNPGGVTVDKSVPPGRLYVWDGGNNRVLGLDLGKCYGQDPPCNADIVIGQPSLNDYGACNRDSGYQNYPERAPASASTLCGSREELNTVLEDKTYSGMYVDQDGNLYLPDVMNHRILKYIKPFETDTIADEVWGQPDFTHNQCNVHGRFEGGAPPTASSLCSWTINPWSFGLAVTLDSFGNLWVADGGNNRVLRFPKGIDGVITKVADLVLGQPSFISHSQGGSLNQMSGPNSLSFDKSGKLYVSDHNNGRILTFNPPFSVGMNAEVFGTDQHNGLNAVLVETDPGNPQEQVVLVYELLLGTSDASLPIIYEMNGAKREEIHGPGQRGGGSIGIDGRGNVLYSAEMYGQDVYVSFKKADNSFDPNLRRLFSPPYGYNRESEKRFGTGAWVGVATAANQLIAGEGRLLFWNDLNSLTNGKPPDGYVGASSFLERPDPPFTQVKSDSADRVWATKRDEIRIYQAPLTINVQPVKIIKLPISTVDGGQIIQGSCSGGDPWWCNEFSGLAVSPDSRFLWISQRYRNRVIRIRDPLTNPEVDVILGQTSLSGDSCNRGIVGEHGRSSDPNEMLNMLCYPGALSINKDGNLFVSDHIVETAGNNRVLVFSSSTFPEITSSIIFAPKAIKEFYNNPQGKALGSMFETAFDSRNRMVAGYNPYSGQRFLGYYLDPMRLNQNNDPIDPSYSVFDGEFKDFYGWPVASTFDSNDNLYVYDANRGQVRKYFHPFPPSLNSTGTPIPEPTYTPIPSPTVIPTSTPTSIPTSTPTPRPTATLTPRPTATKTPTPRPTATSTPRPTATKTPTPRPTATVIPTPTSTNTPTPRPARIQGRLYYDRSSGNVRASNTENFGPILFRMDYYNPYTQSFVIGGGGNACTDSCTASCISSIGNGGYSTANIKAGNGYQLRLVLNSSVWIVTEAYLATSNSCLSNRIGGVSFGGANTNIGYVYSINLLPGDIKNIWFGVRPK